MKSAGEFIDEQTKFGAVAQTREMLADLMIKYASQAIDKCAEEAETDGSYDIGWWVDRQSILKVKDQLK